ncbi:DUF4123 domain-containing protein [Variovorax boronicumulans]|uniref:DUF4123 domain-containing protein n=1 Tax=Variovorax boronicumulans TaxID=436515 RepID=UPI00339A5ED2
MNRIYLQDDLPPSIATAVKTWSDRPDAQDSGSDTVYVVVDGAILGAEGMQRMHAAYGVAVQAFEATALADYEDLGLLLWPWRALHDGDALETLRTVMAGKPGVSFVRSKAALPTLCTTLAWLAAAQTQDGIPLYLRIGDTRVLSTLLLHVRPAQEVRLHDVIRAWAWPDRSGRLHSVTTEAMPAAHSAASTLVLDDAQYAVLFDAAEADMLHAGMRDVEAGWRDRRSGAQLHQWLRDLLKKMQALGIKQQKDQWAFVSLALRAPDGFEALPELGETWLRVRSGAAQLPEEIARWTDLQWTALERLAKSIRGTASAPPKGSI